LLSAPAEVLVERLASRASSGPRMILHHPPGPGRPKTASIRSWSPTTTTRRSSGWPPWAPGRSTRSSSRLRRFRLAWRRSARPRSPARRATGSIWSPGSPG